MIGIFSTILMIYCRFVSLHSILMWDAEKKLLDDLPEVFDSTRSCMTFHAPPSHAAGSLGSQSSV